MPESASKVVIIGAGIAGLCTAVYARRCGYDVELLEQHESAGGLATSWHRGEYTFETCLHWLLGSNPDSAMYSQWREVFDISKLTFIDPEEYAHLETEHGESLSIFTDLDRLESELLGKAPQDAAEIRRFVSDVRRLAGFDLTAPPEDWRSWLKQLRTLPYLPLLRRWSTLSCAEYGKRFTHPLLRSFFGGGETGGLSALALVFSLAWMSRRNAGYAIGGSQAIIRPIVDNIRRLGGRLRLGARVESIRVEGDAAVGVRLAGGETIAADWVISAADGHATIYDLLGGKFRDAATDRRYSSWQTFPSYLQVSFGVARDLSHHPRFLTRLLDAPLAVDPQTRLNEVSFRIFHFDPTFAPPGKTAVTCFLPTYDFAYWGDLQRHDPEGYRAEKHRVAEAVGAILAARMPEIRQAIEVVDVSTPASVIRYTGNWRGSMEGWLLTPGMGFRPLPRTLPGLARFMMVGQWVMPGGGLPSGLMTARAAIQALCKQEGVAFVAGAPEQASAPTAA
jgi:phytoene dehydrogenase-like protein